MIYLPFADCRSNTTCQTAFSRRIIMSRLAGRYWGDDSGSDDDSDRRLWIDIRFINFIWSWNASVWNAYSAHAPYVDSDDSSSEHEVQPTGARGWNDLDDDSDDESVGLGKCVGSIIFNLICAHLLHERLVDIWLLALLDVTLDSGGGKPRSDTQRGSPPRRNRCCSCPARSGIVLRAVHGICLLMLFDLESFPRTYAESGNDFQHESKK